MRLPAPLSDEHQQVLNDIAALVVAIDECIEPGTGRPYGGCDRSGRSYADIVRDARSRIAELRVVVAREERLAEERRRAGDLLLGVEERAAAKRLRADAIALALEEADAEGLRLLAAHAPWGDLRRR